MTSLPKRTLEWVVKVYNFLTKASLRNGTKMFLEPKFFSVHSQIKKITV